METTYQYKQFLTYFNFEKFIPLFEEHQISDEEFKQLTKDDILKIVQKVGPIFKIKQIVKYMASTSPVKYSAADSGFQLFWSFLICFATFCYWSWYFEWFKGYSSKRWVKKYQGFYQVIKNEKFQSWKASLIGFSEALWLIFKMMFTRRTTATATNYQNPPPLSNYQKLQTVLQICTTVFQNQKSALLVNEKFQSLKASLIGFIGALWSKLFSILRTTATNGQKPQPQPSSSYQKSALPQNQKNPATNQKPPVSYIVNPNPPVSSQKPSVLQNLKPAALPQNQKITALNKDLQAEKFLAGVLLEYNSIKEGHLSRQKNKISVLEPSPLPAKQKETPEEPSKKKDPVKENPQIVQKVKSKDPVKESPQIVQKVKSKDDQEQKSKFEHQISDEEPSKKKDPVKEKSQIAQKVKSKDAQEQKSKLEVEPEIPSKMETRSGKKAEPRLSLKKKKENLDPKLKKEQKPKKSSKKAGRKYK